MTLVDPTINIPALTRPLDPFSGYHSTPTRPRSISPSRRDRNLSTSTTLRCVSPDSTLRIIRNSKSLTVTTREDRLVDCIRDTAPADRAFGVRVLQACSDIRSWAALVESWEWPGTFAPPPQDERETVFRDMLLEAGLDQDQFIHRSSCGSLPEQILTVRSAELDRIKHDLNATDVDALKCHIARRTTSRSPLALPEDISPIDEFDGIVTNAILKALPYLSWLQNLLAEWQTRLLVLRKVPAFLDRLSRLEAEPQDANTSPRFQKELIEVGKILDRMLDYLEGRPETLPDEWIDRFERVESRLPAPLPAHTQPAMLHLGSLQADPVSPIIDHAGIFSQAIPDTHPIRSVSPVRTVHRPESPVLGSEPFVYTPTNHEHTHQSSDHSIYEKEMIDQVISEAQDQYFDLGMDEPASAVMTSIPSFPVFVAADFPPMRTPTQLEPSSEEPGPRDSGVDVGSQLLSVSAYDGPLSVVSEEPVAELDSRSDAPTPAFQNDRISDLAMTRENPFARPLEHASSAFTKIFASRARSESNSSRSSIRQRMTPSIRSSISSKRASDLSIGKSSSILSFSREKDRAAPKSTAPEPAATTPSLSATQSPSKANPMDPKLKRTTSLDCLDNWAPVGSRGTQQDMASPKGIMQADFFERLFVDSLPAAPASTSPFNKRDSKVEEPNDDWASDVGPSSPSALVFDNLSFDQIVNTCGPAKPTVQDLFASNSSRTAYDDPVLKRFSSTRGDQAIPRSASMASIENFARSQVRTVNIPRPTEFPAEDRLGVMTSFPSRRQHKKTYSEPHALNMELCSKLPGHNRSMSASAVPVDFPSPRLEIRKTPTAGRPQKDKPLPITPDTSPEDSKLKTTATNTQKRSGSAIHNFSQPLKGVQRRRGPSFKSGDKIDQRINTLLQDLPTHISFVRSVHAKGAPADKIGIAVDSPNPQKPAKHIAAAAIRPRRHPSGIILAPAPDAETTNGYGGKTYYLSMTGSGQPIKLYVRLVGEDERVMVRVGGGWTDLNDYLHQFAQHHGSKTSMDSRVIMEQADRGGDAMARSRSTTPSGRTTPTGRVTPQGRSTPTEPRSTNARPLYRSDTPDAGLTSPDVGSTGGDTPGYTYTHTRSRLMSQASPSSSSTWGPFPTIDNTSSPRALKARAGGASGSVRGDGRPKNSWVEEMLERAKKASLEQKAGMNNTSEPC